MVTIPCPVCKNQYAMKAMKFPKGSQSLVCGNCLEKQQPKKAKGILGSVGSIFKKQPSAIRVNKDWPVVGMSTEQLHQLEVQEKQKIRSGRPTPSMAEYKCLDCGFRFSKHADSKTANRCPYCSKTRVQKIVQLLQEVDTIG